MPGRPPISQSPRISNLDLWSFKHTATVLDSEVGIEHGGDRMRDGRATYTAYLELRWTSFHDGAKIADHLARLRITIAATYGKFAAASKVEVHDGKRWLDLVHLPGSSCGVHFWVNPIGADAYAKASDRLLALALKLLLIPDPESSASSASTQPHHS